MGDCSWCVAVNIIIAIIFICWQIGYFPKILGQWRSLSFSMFVLNMVKGLHIQHRYHHLLFHNFTLVNITAAMAHYSIIQEVDELSAKVSIEIWMGGAGFYSTLNNRIDYVHTFFVDAYYETGTDSYSIRWSCFFLLNSRCFFYMFLL